MIAAPTLSVCVVCCVLVCALCGVSFVFGGPRLLVMPGLCVSARYKHWPLVHRVLVLFVLVTRCTARGSASVTVAVGSLVPPVTFFVKLCWLLLTSLLVGSAALPLNGP